MKEAAFTFNPQYLGYVAEACEKSLRETRENLKYRSNHVEDDIVLAYKINPANTVKWEDLSPSEKSEIVAQSKSKMLDVYNKEAQPKIDAFERMILVAALAAKKEK